MKEIVSCKYCGAKGNGYICPHCREKLKLVRTIRAMLLGCTINKVIRMESQKDKE